MEHKPKNIVIDWQETLLKTDLPYQAKYLGLYLRTYMNAKTDIAWPSLSRIVGETGMSKNTVCRYLKVLESEGWLQRERGNVGKSTRYQAQLPGSVTQTLGSVRETQGVCQRDTRVVSEGHTNKQFNNQLNKQVITKNNNQPPAECSLFDEFWQSYPRKTQKKPARKAWAKLKPDRALLNLITENIKARIAAGDWSEVKFIPHPATYLNQERWEDEIIENTQRPKPADTRRLSPHERVRAAAERRAATQSGAPLSTMGNDGRDLE